MVWCCVYMLLWCRTGGTASGKVCTWMEEIEMKRNRGLVETTRQVSNPSIISIVVSMTLLLDSPRLLSSFILIQLDPDFFKRQRSSVRRSIEETGSSPTLTPPPTSPTSPSNAVETTAASSTAAAPGGVMSPPVVEQLEQSEQSPPRKASGEGGGDGPATTTKDDGGRTTAEGSEDGADDTTIYKDDLSYLRDQFVLVRYLRLKAHRLRKRWGPLLMGDVDEDAPKEISSKAKPKGNSTAKKLVVTLASGDSSDSEVDKTNDGGNGGGGGGAGGGGEEEEEEEKKIADSQERIRARLIKTYETTDWIPRLEVLSPKRYTAINV